jgi:protein-S-isoprenylcysteine O-methyltransferase Ste14
MKSKFMPPTYFIVFLILIIALSFIIPIMRFDFSYFKYLGILLIVIGIILNVWADNLFKKRKTTVKPYEKSNKLIVECPFKVSRHPMYLGMFLILFGVFILLGNLISLILVVIFIILMELLFIKYEEKNMGKNFGKEYLRYKKKVRRWI